MGMCIWCTGETYCDTTTPFLLRGSLSLYGGGGASSLTAGFEMETLQESVSVARGSLLGMGRSLVSHWFVVVFSETGGLC